MNAHVIVQLRALNATLDHVYQTIRSVTVNHSVPIHLMIGIASIYRHIEMNRLHQSIQQWPTNRPASIISYKSSRRMANMHTFALTIGVNNMRIRFVVASAMLIHANMHSFE